ncbi:MAG: hypothetical protein AAFX76_06985, partial [Planctomycetota bacterium]
LAMMGVSHLCESTGREARLLVHPDQAQRPRKQAVLDRYGHPDRYIQDGAIARPWEVLPGCDAVVFSRAPAPLSARYALASGLPIVAPDLPDHREALGDHDRVFYAHSELAKHMADRLQHPALGMATTPMVHRGLERGF